MDLIRFDVKEFPSFTFDSGTHVGIKFGIALAFTYVRTYKSSAPKYEIRNTRCSNKPGKNGIRDLLVLTPIAGLFQ